LSLYQVHLIYDNKQLLKHLNKKYLKKFKKKEIFNLLVNGTTGGAVCVNDCSIKKMSKKREIIINFMIIDKINTVCRLE